MTGQIETAVDCPYCGERVFMLVDPSIPRQAYIEDCAVCCRPMAVRAEVEGESLVHFDARREDEG